MTNEQYKVVREKYLGLAQESQRINILEAESIASAAAEMLENYFKKLGQMVEVNEVRHLKQCIKFNAERKIHWEGYK